MKTRPFRPGSLSSPGREPDGPSETDRRSPEAPEPDSEQARMGRFVEAAARDHAIAGPDRKSTVYTVGDTEVQLCLYDPTRLRLRIRCLAASADPVAVGGPGVVYPVTANPNVGDQQANAGEILAPGDPAQESYRQDAPARAYAVAASATTALVAVTEWFRATEPL